GITDGSTCPEGYPRMTLSGPSIQPRAVQRPAPPAADLTDSSIPNDTFQMVSKHIEPDCGICHVPGNNVAGDSLLPGPAGGDAHSGLGGILASAQGDHEPGG